MTDRLQLTVEDAARLTDDLRHDGISTRTNRRGQARAARHARGFAGWRRGLAPDCGWAAPAPIVRRPYRGG